MPINYSYTGISRRLKCNWEEIQWSIKNKLMNLIQREYRTYRKTKNNAIMGNNKALIESSLKTSKTKNRRFNQYTVLMMFIDPFHKYINAITICITCHNQSQYVWIEVLFFSFIWSHIQYSSVQYLYALVFHSI